MRWGATLFFLAAVTLYQWFALPAFRLGTAAPDFIFLFLAYLALRTPVASLCLIGGFHGLVLDYLSLEPAGTHPIGFLPALWLIYKLRGWFVTETLIGRAVVLFLMALLSLELRRLYVFFHQPGGLTLLSSFQSALYTALAGIAAHAFFDGCGLHAGWARDKRYG